MLFSVLAEADSVTPPAIGGDDDDDGEDGEEDIQDGSEDEDADEENAIQDAADYEQMRETLQQLIQGLHQSECFLTDLNICDWIVVLHDLTVV